MNALPASLVACTERVWLLVAAAVLLGITAPQTHGQVERATVPQTKPNRWALLIGIEGYTQAPRLSYTTNDVYKLADTLEYRGDFAHEKILVLADTEPDKSRHPTRENLQRHIEQFLKLPDASDQVLIFFSGHGFRDRDGGLHLAPIDCDPQNAAGTGISADWLREQLAACRAPRKFLILDSCHAGSDELIEESVVAGDFGNAFRRTEGVVTLASSLGEEKSQIWYDKQQSLFSYWLVQGLKGHADDDTNGEVDFEELYKYVHRQVTRTADVQFPRRQTPVRIVGPGTVGTPTITRLKAQPLKTLVAEMADQLAWEIKAAGLSAVGVIEFSGGSDDNPYLGGDLGVFGKECARQLHEDLVELGTGRFSVVDRQRLQEAFSQQKFAVKDLTSTDSLESIAESVGGMPGMVVGRIVQRNGALVHMLAKIVQTGKPYESGHVGGAAALNESEWGMLGNSVAVKPEVDRRPTLVETTAGQGFIRPESATVIANLDRRSKDGTHPFQDPNFPFRLTMKVDGKPREIVISNGQAYVALRKGEKYVIGIEYRAVGDDPNQTVFMRLLVDGLNTMWEHGRDKGVEVVRSGAPVNLAEAHAWVLEPMKRRSWNVIGFFMGDDKYRDFLVVDASDSLAARTQFTDHCGLITCAFYGPRRAGERGGLGTTFGDEKRNKTERYQGNEKIGNLLGVVTIHYVDPDAIK